MNNMDKFLALHFKNVNMLIIVLIAVAILLSSCSNSEEILKNESVSTTTPINTTKPTILISTTSLAATTVPFTQPISPTLSQLTESNTKNTPGSIQALERRWLSGISCVVPCWENIIPGKTTVQVAVKLLEQIPFITDVKFSNSTFFKTGEPSSGEINWEWANSTASGAINLVSIAPKEQMIVNSIIPFITSLKKPFYPKFKLTDIINSLGNPTNISAELGFINRENPVPGKLTYTIYFFYLNKGVLLSFYDEKMPVLNSELLVSGPIFFVPNDLQSLGFLAKKKNILPWQGFQSFDFYCRDDNSAC